MLLICEVVTLLDIKYLLLLSLIPKFCMTGCKEGFLMFDGNEKVHRRICAAPPDKLHLCRSMPKTISACPNTPQLAGANSESSKYCHNHSYLDDTNASKNLKRPKLSITIKLVDEIICTRHVPATTDLPDNADDSVMNGCKKPCNRSKFFNRTAGVMFAVKPCGVIVDYREMYTCESSSQLFCQLLLLLDHMPHVKYIGYDRACEFKLFLENLSKKGNEGAKKLLGLEYLVDRFHIRGHTTPACDITSPLCQFHPDLEKFRAIQYVNTSCAEQCFSWLKKYKHSVKYMSAYKFKFFLREIIKSRNEQTVALINQRSF